MGQKTQPGGRVDEDTYERFRQFVKKQHGSVRGNLGRELEIAMRERMNGATGPDTLTRIENDVATIKAAVADANTDGGETAPCRSEASTHAHADNVTSTEKPAANAPRVEKLNWLIQKKYDRKGGSTSPAAIKKQVKDEFSFGDRTAEKFVQPFINELDAKKHPKNDEVVMWGTAIEKYKEDVENE